MTFPIIVMTVLFVASVLLCGPAVDPAIGAIGRVCVTVTAILLIAFILRHAGAS